MKLPAKVGDRHVANRIFFGGGRGQEQIIERQNFFVYSDENERIKYLYQYYTRILIITSRRVRCFMNS